MRTNGGCRCFTEAGFDRSATSSAIKMLPELLYLRQRVIELETEDTTHFEATKKAGW